MDWIVAHSAVVSIGLTLFSVATGLVLVFVKPRGYPTEVPLRIALGAVAIVALVSAAFVSIGSSGGTQLSAPTASPISPMSTGGRASNCNFAQDLLPGNYVIQELDVPPDSGDLAGYQVAFSRPMTVPEGWTVQIYGQTHLGPFSVAAGDIASVWSSESCRPLGALTGVRLSSGSPNVASNRLATESGSCKVKPAASPFGPSPNDGGPVSFQIDSTSPGTVVMLDVWIPNVTPEHLQYEMILVGRKLQFVGAGFAWKYVGCSASELQSQVAFHRQEIAKLDTVISITEEDFATLYPDNVVRLPGDSGG